MAKDREEWPFYVDKMCCECRHGRSEHSGIYVCRLNEPKVVNMNNRQYWAYPTTTHESTCQRWENRWVDPQTKEPYMKREEPTKLLEIRAEKVDIDKLMEAHDRGDKAAIEDAALTLLLKYFWSVKDHGTAKEREDLERFCLEWRRNNPRDEWHG